MWDEELAYYLGWLVGDGSFSERGAVTIYGSEREMEELLPLHRTLLAGWAGFVPKPSIQANGTRQLRLMRRSFVDYLEGLGVAKAKAADKVAPQAVLQAPEQCLTAFLRGLFDADGCVVNDLRKGTRYVGLGSKSPDLLRTVPSLLLSLGRTALVAATCFIDVRIGPGQARS
ncbi:LAGLIDADG family homing endonuclease [Ornithinimicrobium sp. Y1847]|uniref:LAGLIDADG family homing endonuclease n=1 Tax=Ornithinimicrobium sp. Y1847 TaxID=3405419 RepID=UPI003B66CDB2